MFRRISASIFLSMFIHCAYSQLIVDNKNITDSPDVQYIQLLYYIDTVLHR